MSSPKKMLFYVDSAWRVEPMGHTPLLFPFWGNGFDATRLPFHHQLFEHHGFDTELYGITEKIEEADVVLMPYPHNLCVSRLADLFLKVQEFATASGLPLLIDGIGDVEHPVHYKKAIILRYGGYRFSHDPREFHIPPYADDLFELYGKEPFTPRPKHDKAVIGFAGWSELTRRQKIRRIIKELPYRLRALVDSKYGAVKKGVFFRIQAREILERSTEVVPNFLSRKSYSGHIKTAETNQETLRQDFVENLLSSDYGLDIRGDANASTRLYEMLSLGCIPVFVDTERNFPFSDAVDYKSFSVMVDFRDMQDLPRIVADFHREVREEQFAQMQLNARTAYVNHFRVDAMTKHIISGIEQRL